MSRSHPISPVLGVGAVIVTASGDVVIVQRGHPPLAGQWSLPGGVVELGETLRAAVAREALEETGLDVEVGPLVDLVERIFRDADGRVEYHYVLADYLCRPSGGTIRAGSDALDARAVAPAALEDYGISDGTCAVIRRGVALAASNQRPASSV